MINAPISAELVLQIEEQFAREEQFLESLQQALQAVTATHETDESEANERPVSIPLQQFQAILVEVETVHHSRRQLCESVAKFLDCSPEDVRMDHLLDSSRTAVSSEISTNVASCRSSVRQIRQKVNRTLGTLQAVVRSLLVERHLVELALTSLGASAAQERYNASGERLLVHTNTPHETRA